ncbi:ABC transporter permease, partial [Enterococcus faecalis]|nr:ABC transporter permease [Enterococcus faecalis]
AIFADFIAPYGMREQNLANALQFPSRSHCFGTDDLGRDVLSRLIYGTRISLTVGVCAVLLALFFGGILGVLSGYFRG